MLSLLLEVNILYFNVAITISNNAAITESIN